MRKRYRNSLEVATQALLLAASVILTVVVISILVVNFKSAEQLAGAADENLTEMADDIKNSPIMQYDGLEVTGADVVNFYKKYLGDYKSGQTGPFTVIISGTSYTNGAGVSSLRDSSSGAYVKPTARYKCSVTKNANGVITSVSFTRS